MSGLLQLTQNAYPRGEQITALVNQCGIRHLEARIYFLNALKEHARLIPLKVFPNPENRLKLVDAIQEALDTEIAKEEEALG